MHSMPPYSGYSRDTAARQRITRVPNHRIKPPERGPLIGPAADPARVLASREPLPLIPLSV